MSIETVNVKKVMELVKTMSDSEFAMIEEQFDEERQARAAAMAADFTTQLRDLFRRIAEHGCFIELKGEDASEFHTVLYHPSEVMVEVVPTV